MTTSQWSLLTKNMRQNTCFRKWSAVARNQIGQVYCVQVVCAQNLGCHVLNFANVVVNVVTIAVKYAVLSPNALFTLVLRLRKSWWVLQLFSWIYIVNDLKPPYKSVNYSSNQRSPKFGSYNIKFSWSLNSMVLLLGRHFSSLLVNFGQNNSLFQPILKACRSMGSCIYLCQCITNMFKCYSQSI